MPFVLDNSVVTGWYLPDQATDYTAAVAERLTADRAVVPALWLLELANVLKTACTRGKLTVEAARQASARRSNAAAKRVRTVRTKGRCGRTPAADSA